MPLLYFTVTNDLTFDQRMIRICSTLANAGHEVVLVGRTLKDSTPLIHRPFKQVRLRCFFNDSFLFYAEYNLRLFFYLIFKKIDGICAIDLDTILPCLFVSKIKRVTRIYDAHELFCEMKEIVQRPTVYKIWKGLEKFAVPRFQFGYTVNDFIANEYYRMYGSKFITVRNISVFDPLNFEHIKTEYILYQGAVNEGRCFESLIPAMQNVSVPLYIYGKGNFLHQAKDLVTKLGLQDKVIFKGAVSPSELKAVTSGAKVGLTLFEKNSDNNYYSLANRFFDYMHGGVPQICVNYPVYKEINDTYQVAYMINDISPESISHAINNLLNDSVYWKALHDNCIIAARELNWQQESKKLVKYYKDIFE